MNKNMLDKLKIALQYLIPQHLLSRVVGCLAQGQYGALTQWCIRHFIAHYKVDMQEAQEPSPEAFATFNDFFTRALKDGVRPIEADTNILVSPADGMVSQCGDIRDGRIFQAKGHDYSVDTLLGHDAELAKQFIDGAFATIYLSPKDYHRVHMPVAGTLRKMTYVPGRLFSVNQLTAQHVPELFARNERLVCVFDTAKGPMVIVLVGATIVAGISTPWAGAIAPRAVKQMQTWHYSGDHAPTLAKGAEMGRFMLGSTAICLYPKDTVQFKQDLGFGSPTRMGETMATYL